MRMRLICCDYCGGVWPPPARLDLQPEVAKQYGWRVTKVPLTGAMADVCPDCSGRPERTLLTRPEIEDRVVAQFAGANATTEPRK